MDIKQYKDSKIKEYKLPSGLIIKVKNISPYTSLKIRSELEKGEDNLLSPKLIEALFKEFLISPKIPDEFAVEDFDAEDFKSILEKITSQITLTKGKKLEEVVDKNKDFPT